MKRVNENLVQYRNESFFNRLVEAQEKEKQEQQKQPQKHAEKDPKTELDLKKEAQAAKDAQDIIKKITIIILFVLIRKNSIFDYY